MNYFPEYTRVDLGSILVVAILLVVAVLVIDNWPEKPRKPRF